MPDEVNFDSNKQLVQSLHASALRNAEGFKASCESVRTRLVWFVGFAGFAILNAKTLWENVHGGSISGIQFLLFALPWLISAVLAVIAHYLSDQLSNEADSFANNKLAAIEMLLATITPQNPQIEKYILIVNDTYPGVLEIKKAADKSLIKVNRLELWSLIFLVFGFFWSVLLPLFLN